MAVCLSTASSCCVCVSGRKVIRQGSYLEGGRNNTDPPRKKGVETNRLIERINPGGGQDK